MGRIGLAGFVVAVLLAAVAGQAHAQQAQHLCKIGPVSAVYKQGIKHLSANNHAAARSSFRPLAEAGFAMAQRHLAEMALAGRGGRKSPSEAAFWSGLAARSGDQVARQVFGEARLGMELEAIRELTARLDDWSPRALSCSNGKMRAAGNGATDKFTYTLNYHRAIADGDKAGIRQRMDGLVKAALSEEPGARLLLNLLDGFEIYPVINNRYHRYTGWKQNSKQRILRLPVTSFDDKEPKFVARQILMTVKRWVYDVLQDPNLEDRERREMGGMYVFGSPYPDIQNRPFFEVVQRALDMAAPLPDTLKRYLDILDAVIYNPASKHMVQEGTIDASAGYYNRAISREAYRVIFIRRDVRFGSPLFMLRLLVHEGTHAAQDQRARNAYIALKNDERKLEGLAQAGRAQSAEARELRTRIKSNGDYAKRWYETRDIAFECEALINEMKVLQILGVEPRVATNSQYLKVCPDAQQEMVRWENERLKNRRNR